MILVTGATGTVGSHVGRLLDERGVAWKAMTRRPDAVKAGVFGDLNDPASLAGALDGVESVFLLTPGGPETPAQDEAMLSAARNAGVRTVVKLSVIDVGPAAQWHQPGEKALQDGGFDWTVLRPTTFASNTMFWAGLIRSGRPIPNPTGSGRQGIVDPRDIAEVAVEALVSPAHHGRTYTLTGPELLSVADQVAVLARILDRDLSTVDLAIADLRANLLANGSTEDYANGVVQGSQLVRDGHNAILTPDVQQVLGRAPRSFATWVDDHRDAFLG
jgi:uncharacterized protein YbjT (DUF2867 family)